MIRKYLPGLIGSAALVSAILACAAPDVESGPATAQAVQQTVIAELTNTNFQLTPDDSQVTMGAAFVETAIAAKVNATQAALQGTVDAAAEGTVAAGGPTQAPVATITIAPTAEPVQTEAPVENQPGMGGVSGKICYPSSSIPPMTIYAKNLGDGAVFQQENAQDQSTYVMLNLPEGDYYLFAYTHTNDGSTGIAIGYTQFVLCGLQAACPDHSMIAVPVNAGETTTEVDICDGYDAAAIPPKP